MRNEKIIPLVARVRRKKEMLREETHANDRLKRREDLTVAKNMLTVVRSLQEKLMMVAAKSRALAPEYLSFPLRWCVILGYL